MKKQNQGLWGDEAPVAQKPAARTPMLHTLKEEWREKIFTVAEYINVLNTFFKAQAVKLTGEVCELKRAASGHVYFTVKDKLNPGVLDCIIWSRNYAICGVELEVGMELVLTGHPNVYPQSGRLSFVADTVELVGEGALKKAYDMLKKKLEAEGLFAPERKRALPEFVQKIGVITSMKGAVIHDFENNLGKYGFTVNVVDTRVEGQAAVKDLLTSVECMRRVAAGGGLDVLVVIRGGGSLESLQGFNNEALVRAIVDFPVPLIAGIGHDQDVPLVALAADFMTSTPTAAAHLLSKPWADAYAKISQVPYLLSRFAQRLKQMDNDLDLAWSSVIDHTAQGIAHIKERVDYAERFLRGNDPKRQLKLGWAIVRQNGKILRSIGALHSGDELETELSDGTIRSKVHD